MKRLMLLVMALAMVTTGAAAPAAASHAPTRVGLRAPRTTEVGQPTVLRGRVHAAHPRTSKVAVLQRRRSGQWRTVERRNIGTRERFRFLRVHRKAGKVTYRVELRGESGRRLDRSPHRTVKVACGFLCEPPPPPPGTPPRLPGDPGEPPPPPGGGNRGDDGLAHDSVSALDHTIYLGGHDCQPNLFGNTVTIDPPTHVFLPRGNQPVWWIAQLGTWDPVAQQVVYSSYTPWMYNPRPGYDGTTVLGWVNYDTGQWVTGPTGWRLGTWSSGFYFTVYNWVWIDGEWYSGFSGWLTTNNAWCRMP